ncbi:hypothetical protein CTI12_AA558730 [Artemisia annua]|uniref:Uncharacterized protein n=1 Tax=Artemisia annua TaxID=35608 RepID=A0A2U1KVR6_ARTAN|nr:hypothetical protein CTI12_AA558730 [Artemisia annua]
MWSLPLVIRSLKKEYRFTHTLSMFTIPSQALKHVHNKGSWKSSGPNIFENAFPNQPQYGARKRTHAQMSGGGHDLAGWHSTIDPKTSITVAQAYQSRVPHVQEEQLWKGELNRKLQLFREGRHQPQGQLLQVQFARALQQESSRMHRP